MKILPMNNYRAITKKIPRTARAFNNNNVLRKSSLGIALLGLTTLTLLGACKKVDDNRLAVTENKDLVDFAFRDFVNLFNLDTIGSTKILKQSYTLNNGDYMIDTFQTQANTDTMYSHGTYYYNGPDQFIPHEQPYTATWTKTQYNGENAVKAEYKYPWASTRKSDIPYMPIPEEIYYIPGEEGDNSMKMHVNMGGLFNPDVDVTGETATYKVEDKTIINPFRVSIEENY